MKFSQDILMFNFRTTRMTGSRDLVEAQSIGGMDFRF